MPWQRIVLQASPCSSCYSRPVNQSCLLKQGGSTRDRVRTRLKSMSESLGRLPGGGAGRNQGTALFPTPPHRNEQVFKLKRIRKSHDAMGLNQGMPALRNNTSQALGHNPQDILVSKSGVATPSTSSNYPQEGLRHTGLERGWSCAWVSHRAEHSLTLWSKLKILC